MGAVKKRSSFLLKWETIPSYYLGQYIYLQWVKWFADKQVKAGSNYAVILLQHLTDGCVAKNEKISKFHKARTHCFLQQIAASPNEA